MTSRLKGLLEYSTGPEFPVLVSYCILLWPSALSFSRILVLIKTTLEMASSTVKTVTSTPKPNYQELLSENGVPSLAILADTNVQDPRPATIRELVGCDFLLHRVYDMPSFLLFTAPPGSLSYLVIACLTPIISEFAEVANPDDREVALGKFFRKYRL